MNVLLRKAATAVRLGSEAVVAARRRHAIARAAPAADGVHVFYGVERMPGPDEPLAGGLVKSQRLTAVAPNAPRAFNLLYLVSSARPRDTDALVRLARRRGAAFIWNQNGVAYRAWHGPGWERANAPLARALHSADHVLFQSEFCRTSASRFLGEREGPSEVLYNAVDTRVFAPAPLQRRPLTLLLGGNQYRWYRVESAVRTLARVRREVPDARLLVTGALGYDSDPSQARARFLQLCHELALDDAVELTGTFSQREAPAVLARGDVLLHTQYNDACPGIVLEAMACGLPVAYSASGGVPELVGDDAGIGVPAPLDYEHEHPPPSEPLATAVLALTSQLEERREAARQRAVARFDIQPWLQRHLELFAGLAPR
jgi:glycosyltransferase involved in cell wall biosynthesis